MEKHNLDSLSLSEIGKFLRMREIHIGFGSSEMPLAVFNANEVAHRLHPSKQYLKVCEVTQQKDCKIFKLVPDTEQKTENCAYFSAGQYISVKVNIDGKIYSRPYSIASSPKEALSGFYNIAVKSVSGGLVSNYILDNWQVGTTVEASDPTGNFTYEPLRDAKHVLCVAGGSGITPFVSMAKAVADGDEECTLTLLYGTRTEEDILFKSELDKLSENCHKIKVIYVLSEEQKDGFEHGFISEKLMRKYISSEVFSVFLCGPDKMISFVDKELEKLSLESKYVRHEVHGEIYSPFVFEDYPDDVPTSVNITVTVKGKTTNFTADTNSTILRSLEKNGIAPPNRCRSGECGFCHSRLISGKVYIPKDSDKRRLADEKFGHIHPCCSFPVSDIHIEVSEG